MLKENKTLINTLRNYLWAKENPTKSLYVHLLETATVSSVLLSKSVFVPLTDVLVKNSNLTKNEVVSLVSYIAGVHDIGKIHPAFISRTENPVLLKFLQEHNLVRTVDQFRHERYGKALLTQLWKDKNRFDEDSDDIAMALSDVVYQHHQGKTGTERFLGKDKVWFPLQEELERFMFQRYPFPRKIECKNIDVFCTLILGILIASDWISSGSYFTYTAYKNLSYDAVVKNAEKITMRFLSDNNLLYSKPLNKISDFSSMWQFIPKESMRPLQETANRLFSQNKEEMPLGVIVEAPMGEGKTEAGLYIASQLAKYWNKDGFYLALPTAATSNQMYSRMNDMFSSLNIDNKPKLMHSASWIMDTEEENKMALSDDSNTSAVLWTAPLRRGMISQYAVGTIDQVMMSVMRVKYGVLRLAGLVNKVLIIDEIHSYDAYMNSIITILLHWCKAMSIPVVMLSATLPIEKKKEFATVFYPSSNAFIKGLYPSYTLLYPSKKAEQISVKSSYRSLTFAIDYRQCLNNMSELTELVEDYFEKNDGCVCIMRNTVKSAQETYLALKHNSQDVPVLLFHAQFEAIRRKELEELCIQMFGKDTKKRPKRFILIATQVVEQSLDIDFDYIITDICPIDLLLQRIGREYRHETTPRPNNDLPKVTVLIPKHGESYYSVEYVYARILLDRTLKVIKKLKTIQIPQDIPLLVEKVYDSDTVNFNDADKWYRFMLDENAKALESRLQTFQRPDPYSFMFSRHQDAFSEDESGGLPVCTRLGKPNTHLIFADKDLYKETKEAFTNRNIAKEFMLHSVAVNQYKVRYLDDENLKDVVKGEKILTGYYILCVNEKKEWCGKKHMITMDNELGLLLK